MMTGFISETGEALMPRPASRARDGLASCAWRKRRISWRPFLKIPNKQANCTVGGQAAGLAKGATGCRHRPLHHASPLPLTGLQPSALGRGGSRHQIPHGALLGTGQPLRSGGHNAPADVVLTRLDVCEVKKRGQRMSLVTSEEMRNEISLNGKVAL